MAVLLGAACSGGTPASDSSPEAPAAPVDYSDNSLIAYHEKLGDDISSLTEVSVDNCSDCHGDRSAIQASTEGILEGGGTTANPHVNHMTKELECGNCHSLTGTSTLYCNQCHAFTITKDNEMWEAGQETSQ